MTDQPTVYATLFDFAADQPRRRIEERLVQSAREDAQAGFQQGVQAASDE